MSEKKYLLIGGEEYYPAGGFNDYVGAFDSQEEAKREAERCLAIDWDDSLDAIEWAEITEIENNLPQGHIHWDVYNRCWKEGIRYRKELNPPHDH